MEEVRHPAALCLSCSWSQEDPSETRHFSVCRCNRRDVESTRFKVEDLTEGDEYEFRVVAYNAAGASRPSTTAGPIIIQDQTCKGGAAGGGV